MITPAKVTAATKADPEVERDRQQITTNSRKLRDAGTVVKAAAAAALAATPTNGTPLRTPSGAAHAPALAPAIDEDEVLTPEAIRNSRRAVHKAINQIRQSACDIVEARAEITRTTMHYDGPRPTPPAE